MWSIHYGHGILKRVHQAFYMIGKMFPMLSGKFMLIYCINEVIKGNIFWRLNKICRPMRQLQPETGEYLAIFFKTPIQLYLFCLFFYYWITVSKRVSKAIFLYIKLKSVGLWGTYGLKQGNTLKNIKISNHIVFFLSPDLLFYLINQKGYQR